MSVQQLRDLIARSIREEGAIRMYYRNNNGNASIRVVEPVGWDNDYVFTAYCHLRQEERAFKLSNILEWQYFNSVEDALDYDENPLDAEIQEQPPQTLPMQRSTRPNAAKSATIRSAVFSEVKNTDQWSRLLRYYAQCIIREYQQQYELEREYLKPFPCPTHDIEKFLLGETSLEFKVGYQLQQIPTVSFIQKHRQDSNKQLCIGYPFLVLHANKIFPLIYSPVEVISDHQRLILQAEGFEVSYAALKSLHMDDDEILGFLDECEQVTPTPGQSVIDAISNLLLQKLNEVFRTGLKVYNDRMEPMSIYASPCLFWVTGNNITGNLINELHELADKDWSEVGSAMKQVLTIQPDHVYPEVTKADPDLNLYVTPVNQQQIRAVHASRSEPVLIVTGPPGTGKSQLVLNIIAQSFMNGETVLFASRNNRAVDVVMNRLQNELNFRGAVRTGKTEYRETAAQRMRAALNSIGESKNPGTFQPVKHAYEKARQSVSASEEQLKEVRRLNGLLTSYKAERDAYLGFLPKNVGKLAETNIPAFQTAELENLQLTLSTYLETGLSLKDLKSQIEQSVTVLETKNALESPLLTELHNFEDQWGVFGGGFLRHTSFPKISDLFIHLQTWLDLIEFIELTVKKNAVNSRLSQAKQQFAALNAQLPGELAEQIEKPGTVFTQQKLESLVAQAKELHEWFTRAAEKPAGFLGQFLHWFKLGRYFSKQATQLTRLQQDLGLKALTSIDIRALKSEGLAIASGETIDFLSVVLLQQAIEEMESTLQTVNDTLPAKAERVPEVLREDLNKLRRLDFDNNLLRARLMEIQSDARELENYCNDLGTRINRKIESNEDRMALLTEFSQSPAGKDDRLWKLFLSVDPQAIVNHVTKWHNILSFWGAQAGMTHIQSQLKSMPTEDNAISIMKNASDELMRLSGDLMRATWFERARNIDNVLMQRVHDYVSAVEALTRGYDSANYQYFKAMEKSNLAHAVKLFPIWATTNLSAKSNFPLSGGFFDVVIIDEASQCDLPSALPLLYRAKRIIIIGDPNQLRHVATLKKELDLELAAKYGVGPDAYLYKLHSLFDIANRSAGSNPGTLLLNEHYRSDHRIISFSNREFYENKLVIRTDLSVRNIRKTFLNDFGGIFWLNVAGQAERARNSNFNNVELAQIQTLVPKLFESLKRHEMEGSGVGIVTPYREQANLLQNWALSLKSIGHEVTTGTAHTFQGDERDFMIFSPVAAPGLSEGSLTWLDNEKNLLNVAVTRARITLIVVGDWSYCKALPVSHAFHRIAQYVEEQGRIVSDLEALPFFGKPMPNIIGYLTDPHNPEHNRTTLRRFVSACKEFVWWIDPYLTDHIVDLFWDVFQDPSVTIKQVQLITAVEQTQPGEENRKPQLNINKFNQFHAELAERGIAMSLRLLQRRQLPHDRLFYAPSQAINMPPFSGAYGDHRHVSEYTQSLTDRNLFLKYWEEAEPIVPSN